MKSFSSIFSVPFFFSFSLHFPFFLCSFSFFPVLFSPSFIFFLFFFFFLLFFSNEDLALLSPPLFDFSRFISSSILSFPFFIPIFYFVLDLVVNFISEWMKHAPLHWDSDLIQNLNSFLNELAITRRFEKSISKLNQSLQLLKGFQEEMRVWKQKILYPQKVLVFSLTVFPPFFSAFFHFSLLFFSFSFLRRSISKLNQSLQLLKGFEFGSKNFYIHKRRFLFFFFSFLRSFIFLSPRISLSLCFEKLRIKLNQACSC